MSISLLVPRALSQDGTRRVESWCDPDFRLGYPRPSERQEDPGPEVRGQHNSFQEETFNG